MSLKVLLTAIAIVDDLGAIVIIAVFYTADLSWISIALAAACGLGLFVLNRPDRNARPRGAFRLH